MDEGNNCVFFPISLPRPWAECSLALTLSTAVWPLGVLAGCPCVGERQGDRPVAVAMVTAASVFSLCFLFYFSAAAAFARHRVIFPRVCVQSLRGTTGLY